MYEWQRMTETKKKEEYGKKEKNNLNTYSLKLLDILYCGSVRVYMHRKTNGKLLHADFIYMHIEMNSFQQNRQNVLYIQNAAYVVHQHQHICKATTFL